MSMKQSKPVYVEDFGYKDADSGSILGSSVATISGSQGNDEALRRMRAFYRAALPINQVYHEQAQIDARFAAGDQKIWGELYRSVKNIQNHRFTFNRIKRIINMISGLQRQNRKSIIAKPRERNDEETASQFSKILFWISHNTSLLETISDSFQETITTGLTLLEFSMRYDNDPISGDIHIDRCSFDSFVIDPYFKKADMSDCNGLWRRSYLTKSECKLLLPGNESKIDNIRFVNENDGRFTGMIQNRDLVKNRLLAYDEFYYRAYRKKKILYDINTRETTEWRDEDEDKLKWYLSKFPEIDFKETIIPTVQLTVAINDNIMYDGKNPLGIDRYPFVPLFADYNPTIQDYDLRIQGLVRTLRDSQYLYNRRKIIELDILESQVTSGWKFKPSSLIDPLSPYETGQGKGIALKKGALMTDAERLTPPSWDPNMLTVSQTIGDEMEISVGLTKEMLGTDDKDISGVVSVLRHKSALQGLQGLYDNLDRSMQYVGDILIELVQTHFAPGKVMRIIEEEPAPQFYDRLFGKFDAVVEDGLNTTTQKQMQFAQLLQLKEVGVNIPGELLIDAAPLQNKKDLREAVAKAEQQAAEMEQRKLQSDMIEQEARAKLAEARAFADEGLGVERISRIQENEALAAERYAEAEKDRTLGELNIVRTLKELDDIDISQMEKLLNIALMMKTSEQASRDQGAQRSAQDQTAARVIASSPSRALQNAGGGGGGTTSGGAGKLPGLKPEVGSLTR